MEINNYLNSGILEAYVLGATTDRESADVQFMKTAHPRVAAEIKNIESRLEQIAEHGSKTPPPDIWDRVDINISELIISSPPPPRKLGGSRTRNDDFIEVRGTSNQIKVHKIWRWIFGAVFVLSKVFLVLALYFYFENKHAQQELTELKIQMEQQKVKGSLN